ncbi:hypothetical protein COCON_G00203440 [Conger conger]|uniref:Receptor activity modifying protein 2 n=1 Tax=Conger conger TaxID=82655 RepID=A0A9Q1HP91_CONCO|nr:receptor activity-modifying protein 1-like [Conger conger]KAJ8253732.1 hypothetical protein COCON_G00203440 [Conger conger]
MDNTSSSQLILPILFWVMWVGSACGGTESLPVTIPGPTISSNPFTQHYACGDKTKICPQICRSCEGSASRGACFTMHLHNCIMQFVRAMDAMNNTNLCIWNNIQRPYNTFTLCSEDAADCLLIPWPNPVVEETFRLIHSSYFLDCPEELRDPPASVGFALAMTPICIIPVMVVLVVLKTKNGDGSSW